MVVTRSKYDVDIHRSNLQSQKNIEENIKQRLDKIIGKLDFTTLLFFLGILMAVNALIKVQGY